MWLKLVTLHIGQQRVVTSAKAFIWLDTRRNYLLSVPLSGESHLTFVCWLVDRADRVAALPAPPVQPAAVGFPSTRGNCNCHPALW